MSNVTNIEDYRRKRDLQAVRIASAICRREARIREHDEALIAINKFYKLETDDANSD